MKPGLVRIGMLVERDRRLRLDREPGPRCAVIIPCGRRDRKRLAGPDRLVGGGQFQPELRRGQKPGAKLPPSPSRGPWGGAQPHPASAAARLAGPAIWLLGTT